MAKTKRTTGQLFKRGKFWWAEWAVDGERKHCSLKVPVIVDDNGGDNQDEARDQLSWQARSFRYTSPGNSQTRTTVSSGSSMSAVGTWSLPMTVIVGSPSGGQAKRISWTRNKEKQKELVVKLQEAESKHDFYTKLYRQYTTDLLKLVPYIRKVVTNPSLAAYLEEHHPAAFADFASITLDASHG